MATTTKPTGNNATAARADASTQTALKTLTAGIFDLTDHEHAGKAEGALRLASWMFGVIATLDTIRAKAEYSDRLAKELAAESVAINDSIFTIEHATAMQLMLLDAAHACRDTQACIEDLHTHAQAILNGGAA
jgi:hypothetical protein